MKRLSVSNKIRRITYAATFVVLGVIFSRLSVYIPVAGAPIARLGLASIPIVISSIMLGPIYGGIVGGLSDLIGALAFPVGAYFFGFTLDSALLGVLPALVLYLYKKGKAFIPLIYGFLCIASFIALTLFLSFFDKVTIAGNLVLQFNLVSKIIVIICYALLLAASTYLCFRLSKREKGDKIFLYLTMVFLNEILISTYLAAFWKYQLYGISYLVNIGTSAILLLFNLPVKTAIIFSIQKAFEAVPNLRLEKLR